MTKKVLMTASTLAHIINFHLPYIDSFNSQGWEVHVAASGEVREIPGAFKVFCLPFEKSFTSPENLRTAAKLRRIMLANHYDLIICHTSLAAFFTRLATLGIKGKTRLINVVHGYLFDEKTNALKAMVLRSAEYLMAGQTDLVLTMNDWDYKWAKEHKISQQVQFIPGMGIKPMENSDIPMTPESMSLKSVEEDFVLVYPAEFSKRKNQAMLIKSMRLLPKNVKLVLPGDGENLEECRTLAQKLSLADRVIFPGYVNNIVTVLEKADAAVSSSCSEGLPFNVMEAMLMGLPVIASRVKGHTDLVEHGVNGYLFDYDDEKAFTQAVMKLAQDRRKAKVMGNVGREKVRQFELENVQPLVMHQYLC